MKRRNKKSNSFDVLESTVDNLKIDVTTNLHAITERMSSIDFQMKELATKLHHITQSVDLIETQTKED